MIHKLDQKHSTAYLVKSSSVENTATSVKEHTLTQRESNTRLLVDRMSQELISNSNLTTKTNSQQIKFNVSLRNRQKLTNQINYKTETILSSPQRSLESQDNNEYMLILGQQRLSEEIPKRSIARSGSDKSDCPLSICQISQNQMEIFD